MAEDAVVAVEAIDRSGKTTLGAALRAAGHDCAVVSNAIPVRAATGWATAEVPGRPSLTDSTPSPTLPRARQCLCLQRQAAGLDPTVPTQDHEREA